MQVAHGAGSTVPWSRTAAGFGTIVFLASDLMLFAAFFSAYFVLRGTTTVWPPPDVDLDVARAAAATIVLLASSATLARADRALEHGDGGVQARRWILVTMALGAVFLVNQVLEYASLEFAVDTHPYGSVFWLLTGLHGAHVAAGVGALGMLFVRVVRAPDRRRVLPFATSVSAYWHMVDVVWLGVFSTIWLLQ